MARACPCKSRVARQRLTHSDGGEATGGKTPIAPRSAASLSGHVSGAVFGDEDWFDLGVIKNRDDVGLRCVVCGLGVSEAMTHEGSWVSQLTYSSVPPYQAEMCVHGRRLLTAGLGDGGHGAELGLGALL